MTRGTYVASRGAVIANGTLYAVVGFLIHSTVVVGFLLDSSTKTMVLCIRKALGIRMLYK